MRYQTSNAVTVPQKRVTRTRSALSEALLSLLKNKNFENISIREITAQAEVGYATFFRHYPDKESLLHDLVTQEINELINMTLPILYSEDSESSSLALCRYVWGQRKLWAALLTGGAAAILKEAYIAQALEIAKEKSEPDLWLPENLAVSFTVTASIEILTWWLKQPEPVAVEIAAKYLNKLAIDPIIDEA